jgi:hypothetical protein
VVKVRKETLSSAIMFQFQDIAQAAQALHAVQAAEKAEAEAEAAKPKVNQPHPNPWYKHYSIYPLGFALVINSLAIISLPWLPGTIVYLIQTSFPNSITGTLNGVSVINLNNLRVSLACDYDLDLG